MNRSIRAGRSLLQQFNVLFKVAREVAWAARQVEDSGVTLTWRKVRNLTNMRRRDFEACMPYIPDYADSELAEQILHLL